MRGKLNNLDMTRITLPEDTESAWTRKSSLVGVVPTPTDAREVEPVDVDVDVVAPTSSTSNFFPLPPGITTTTRCFSVGGYYLELLIIISIIIL